MKIKEIAYVCYPVTDVPKARAFYETLLGLKPTQEWVSEKMAFIEYDIANCTLVIGMGSQYFKPGKSGPCVALEVHDMDKAVEKIRAAKVKILMGPDEFPTCHMCLIEDPDGNQLMLHRRK